MYDANLDVARAAIESAGTAGRRRFPVRAAAGLAAAQPPAEVGGARGADRLRRGGGRAAGLLHARSRGRQVGPPARAVDARVAALPASVEALLGALDDPDGFIRFKAVAALDRLRRSQSGARRSIAAVVTRHVNTEAARAFNALTLHYNLFVAGGLDQRTAAGARADREAPRALNRTLTLLGLIHAPDDVAAVRHALDRSTMRGCDRAPSNTSTTCSRAKSRKRVMLLIEEMPAEERMRKGNVIYRTRTRDVEDTRRAAAA